MRATLPIAALLCATLAGCAPTAPPPAATSTQATPDPRDPQVRAQAVEQATMEAKQRQDEALEKQGG
jgi:ABC-type uncharacterized transport system auxiliary subunit